MLEGYGLHSLIWDACDERFNDVLVASSADARGRGISLAVREGGAAANLTGATVYFIWRHKVTGERGTEPFTAVDASAGTFEVFYPAAMCGAAGAVQAQVMVSRGDGTYISSRVFTIRVEPVIIGGEEHEDEFTLFVDAINAYENTTEISTAAATAANQAAQLADTARTELLAAAENGGFDGTDGRDGADGFSPTATVTATEGGRELLASGHICAEAKYQGLGFTSWDGVTGPTHREHLTSARFAADMAAYSYLNLQYLFYSCTNLASVSGLGNLSGVRSMRFTFASAAVTVMDFRGFDPSALTDLYYAFSGCKKLAAIYADASWALPSSGITGAQCFCNCSTSLVGGNGTVWASSKTAYTYFRIDTASTPGYLTAA